MERIIISGRFNRTFVLGR